MLEQLIMELAKSTKQVGDINGDKTYLVINKDDGDLDIEIKFLREQYEEKASSYFKVSSELLKNAWQKFIDMRTLKSEDFGQVSECNDFLIAFFSQLPFVNVTESGAITFKEFQTDNLPCEQYHKVVGFLEEVINNTYDPKNLSDQTNGNLYRVKSKGRQDLRLLGFK